MGKRFDFLEGELVSEAFSLCGRNAVQITASRKDRLALKQLKARLSTLGEVVDNDFFLTFKVNQYELIIFPEARAIIKGTTDETVACGLFSKYVGN